MFLRTVPSGAHATRKIGTLTGNRSVCDKRQQYTRFEYATICAVMDPEWPEIVLERYAEGLFLMPDEKGRLEFYISLKRAVFLPNSFHVSRSLRRTLRSRRFTITADLDFLGVIRGCQRPSGTWITQELVELFTIFHKKGVAHSIEVWREDRLVGGVYGLAFGAYFVAESMFHTETDASRVALWALTRVCDDAGFGLVDAQIMTPHLKSLGATPMLENTFSRIVHSLSKQKQLWGTKPPEESWQL